MWQHVGVGSTANWQLAICSSHMYRLGKALVTTTSLSHSLMALPRGNMASKKWVKVIAPGVSVLAKMAQNRPQAGNKMQCNMLEATT